MPDEVDQRLGEIETALAALKDRSVAYDPAEVTRAGVFVSIDHSGALRVERGYVRPEDEPIAPEPEPKEEATASSGGLPAAVEGDDRATSGTASAEGSEDDEGVKALPDRLMTELTAHRTLALRRALGERPDIAFLAALHVLCLRLFYRYGSDSCLDVDAKSIAFGSQAPGLNDTPVAKGVDDRHHAWAEQLPREPGELWDVLLGFDRDRRQALFAHCIALSLNAVYEPWNRRPRALIHADRIAEAVGLDMATAGWSPTVENYLGRVTKARILQAVREAKDEASAQLLDHMKKAEMAEKAQALLEGSGWLPEPLRTPARATSLSPDDDHAVPPHSSRR
jgi:ParB family chromosome partitioning protein